MQSSVDDDIISSTSWVIDVSYYRHRQRPQYYDSVITVVVAAFTTSSRRGRMVGGEARRHLKQRLLKRHGRRPVSIRSRFTRTPLTKNGKNYLRHPPGQTPGHRDNGPTRRRQARAVRDRARVAKREIRLRTRASTPPHKTRPSKSFLPLKTTLSRSVSTEGARDLRGGATAGRTHTTGGVSGIKTSHHQENKFYLLTKVKSSNQQTKNI